MKTYRGYALIEIVVMIAAVVLLMALAAEPARTALAEVPRADANYQTWLKTQDLLEAMREDIEQTEEIWLSWHNEFPDPNSYFLVLETPAGLVEYTLTGGQASRTVEGQPAMEWDLPYSRAHLSAWPAIDEAYGVEVTTWIQRQAGNRVNKNFEQTHVFFRKAL